MPPEILVLAVILLALTLYAVLGGADFGAGVWEFQLAFEEEEDDQRLIDKSIGPVWEANHVWLIFVLMLLAGCFPPAFAALCQAFWLPWLLALGGIVARGSAFAFRSHSHEAPRMRRFWVGVFAAGSTAAPFFLGASVGALAEGEIPLDEHFRFRGDFLAGWLTPLAIYSAFFAVGMCAYLAAFYLWREAALRRSEVLATRWRRRGLSIGIWMGVLSLAGVALMAVESPEFFNAFRSRAWPLLLGSLACGGLSLLAVWRRKPRLGVLASAATVAAVVLGWGIAKFPYLVPPGLTIEQAKAPDSVLWLVLACVGAGAVLLVPSLLYLLWLFKSETHAEYLRAERASITGEAAEHADDSLSA